MRILPMTLLGLVVGCATPARPGQPPTVPVASGAAWDQHVRAIGEARQRSDWAAGRAHLQALHLLAPNASDLLVSLSQNAMRRSDRADAIHWLGDYAATGLTFDVAGDPLLSPLAADPAAAAVQARLSANAAPVPGGAPVFALPAGDQLFEDLAWDPVSRRLLVASVRGRNVVSVATDGSDPRPLTPPAREGVGVLGLVLDAARRVLWVSESPLPHVPGFRAGDERTVSCALVALDPSTGTLQQRIELAPDGSRHVLADLAVTPAGDVLVADGAGGGVYVLRAGGTRLDRLPASFVSPQTPAPAEDGFAYVPDYALGIARLDLRSGGVTWLSAPPEIALEGIDGLYRVGATLLAVQNGTTPRRVLRLSLAADGRSITSARTLVAGLPDLGEPTHGTWVDGEFWFLAHSGWARFDDDGKPAADAPPDAPAVWRLSRAH